MFSLYWTTFRNTENRNEMEVRCIHKVGKIPPIPLNIQQQRKYGVLCSGISAGAAKNNQWRTSDSSLRPCPIARHAVRIWTGNTICEILFPQMMTSLPGQFTIYHRILLRSESALRDGAQNLSHAEPKNDWSRHPYFDFHSHFASLPEKRTSIWRKMSHILKFKTHGLRAMLGKICHSSNIRILHSPIRIFVMKKIEYTWEIQESKKNTSS